MTLRIKSTDKEYGLAARSFHWTNALIVLALLSLGTYMTGLEASPFKFSLYFWHKSFGILVLIIVFFRLVWRLANDPPPPLRTHERWERIVSRIVHGLLYLGLVVMPLSGWLMSSAGDFPASFFGLFEMPAILPKNEAAFDVLRLVHRMGAYALMTGIALHVAAAAKHHLLDKDETLIRMGGRTFIIPVTAVLLIIPAGLAVLKAGAPASYESSAVQAPVRAAETIIKPPGPVRDVPQWAIVPEQSRITFEATQYGETFSGQFQNFTGSIYFDTNKLQKSRADIEIDITSIETGSSDRDRQAKGREWFDTGRYPKAYFQTRNIVRSESNRYVAKGYLTVKGVTIPVELPFTLTFKESAGDPAAVHMGGGLSLARRDFGIGTGQWEDTETIGNEVKITVSVFARLKE